MTNFTLESLQNFNINRAVFEACMGRVEYESVVEEEGGKVLRLRDTSDNDLIEIKLNTDGTYESHRGARHVCTDTFEQALVEGLLLNHGDIIPLVNKIVAQDAKPEFNQNDYYGIKLKYTTTVTTYFERYRDNKERYGAEITGLGRDMNVHLKLDDGRWMGYADNSKTHEVSIFDTSDLKSILEDISRMQNNAINNDLIKTPIDMRPFNTPERFDALIEAVQQAKEPDWSFVKEDNLER